MHGTIMLFVFLGPFAFAGLGNYLVPLMIGAPDMAFPRFNDLSYWLYLGGFVTMSAGFLTNNGAANFGWFGYAPLTEAIHSPGPGADLWIVGVALTGFSGIFTGGQHHHDHLLPAGARAWSCSACRSSCGTSWSPCS